MATATFSRDGTDRRFNIRHTMTTRTTERTSSKAWPMIALIWFLLLCFAPDPRPLATPAWSIAAVKSALGLQDAAARVVAAIALGMVLLGILGMLWMRAFGGRRFDRRSLTALGLAPLLGIITLWISRGYFPIAAQLKLAVVATLAGALAMLLLRRNWIAGIALLALLGLTYGLLTNYKVSDDLVQATRKQVAHLLQLAPSVPDGDEAFLSLTRAGFTLAAERSASGDPVLENQAAVLALALVLGDEKLAQVADRYVDPGKIPLCEQLRARTTLHGRADWSRHFWVSAGLVVLSDSERSLNVGIIKELKDTNPGGSGFSFGDLTADGAGQQFALATTRDVPSAVAMQQRVQGAFAASDLMPDARDLPEGITANDFHEYYGGAGGARTDSLVQVIRQRLEATPLLH